MSLGKILVANRGEIACRILRTAHRLGYRTVAVYSDADAGAPHVRQADEAVHLGAAPASASYLNAAAVIDAARRTGAGALHPGYGFLSENADFAQACADAGIVFVGPPPAAMRAMADKAAAKQRMQDAGVPCAPGSRGENLDDVALAVEAARLGPPLLVKAVAGGGGRGMRLVHDLADLPAAIAGARREATAAFGDGRLMLERLIEHGRHIEVQVFADAHGHVLHLGERDCTAQRRRQKVVEEAPSPFVDAALREAMGRDAVAAARAVGYRGAGTVEFLVDAARRHHFLEMNTRLQVEHPVTECITGFDLVEWQLRIAAGEPLPVTQDELRFDGHAIEARLYAEDPCDDFRPQCGRIAGWRPQAATIRIDHGIEAGSEVTPWYDAMLAKYVAHGRDRADAIRRLTRALEDVPLLGLRSNGRFLRDLVRHPEFAAATMTTDRIDDWARRGEALLQRPPVPEIAWRIAAAWHGGDARGLRPQGVATFEITLECDGDQRRLQSPPAGIDRLVLADGELRCRVDGVQRRFPCVADDGRLHLAIDAAVFTFTEASPWPQRDAATDPRQACAPVAGVVARVEVAVGDAVAAGQPLVCVEAMKMELWLHAAADGTVHALHAAVGQPVAAGALLVELETRA